MMGLFVIASEAKQSIFFFRKIRIESVIIATTSHVEDSYHAIFDVIVMGPIRVAFCHFRVPLCDLKKIVFKL